MRRPILRFLVATLLVGALACGIGYYPTVALAGREARSAVFVGAGIGLASSWAGAVPALAARRSPASRRAMSALGSAGVRVLVAVVLTAAAAWAGWVPIAPLLVWAAVGYIVLLPADVAFSVEMIRTGVPKNP